MGQIANDERHDNKHDTVCEWREKNRRKGIAEEEGDCNIDE